jgi:hypothetical protein
MYIHTYTHTYIPPSTSQQNPGVWPSLAGNLISLNRDLTGVVDKDGGEVMRRARH